MAAGALAFFVALASLAKRGTQGATTHRPPKAPPPAHAVTPTPADLQARPPPPEWPQVVPAGLPPFPGSGWVPDVPLSSGVRERAVQLRPVLWKHGVNTHKTEQTSGRWITYVAKMHGGKQAVEAFHLASEAPIQPAPEPEPAPVIVKPTPTSPPVVVVPEPPPKATSSPERQELAAKVAANLAGKAKGKEDKALVTAYQKLASLTPDGMYGPNMGHQLAADGIVPPSPLYWPKAWNAANKAIKDWKAYAAQQAALETDETRRLAWEESGRGAKMVPNVPYAGTNIQAAAAKFFMME